MPDEFNHWLTLPSDKLTDLIRAEAKRGREGHWSYEVTRHRNMLEALRQVKQRECSVAK